MLVWLLAGLSVLLPIAGVAAALYGVMTVLNGQRSGYAWLAAGVVVLIADLVIDTKWSRWWRSTESDLNRRGDQLVGEVVTVIEPIIGGGRGKVRAGDSVWSAEGADASAGAKVRVTACNSTVLQVEPL